MCADTWATLRFISTMGVRTKTGTKQGSQYFFNLKYGDQVSRNTWTVLRIPNNVLDQVDEGISF